jgi:hypothetical protein
LPDLAECNVVNNKIFTRSMDVSILVCVQMDTISEFLQILVFSVEYFVEYCECSEQLFS